MIPAQPSDLIRRNPDKSHLRICRNILKMIGTKTYGGSENMIPPGVILIGSLFAFQIEVVTRSVKNISAVSGWHKIIFLASNGPQPFC